MDPYARSLTVTLVGAIVALYFSAWLTPADGPTLSGLVLVRDALEPRLAPYGPSAAAIAASLIAWTLPALACAALVAGVRGRYRPAGVLFGVAALATAAVAFGLPRPSPAAALVVRPSVAAVALCAAAIGLLALGLVVRPRAASSHRVTEYRGDDGTSVIQVDQNRWRPLARLALVLVHAAIAGGALALWGIDRFPAVAEPALRLGLPAAALAAAVAVIRALRTARRRVPRARIRISPSDVEVLAGGDPGRYPRERIGGLYIPHPDGRDTADRYYRRHHGRNTLTLPVATPAPAPIASHPLSLAGDSRRCVAMNLRDRNVILARHLTHGQSAEVLRRVRLRLLN